VASLIRLPNRYPAPAALFLAPPFSYVAPANRTLMLAVIASVLLHAMLLAARFTLPGSTDRAAAPAALEVVLVNARTVKAPVKADVRAQSNLDGGGNTDAPHRLKTPLPQSATGVDIPDPAAAARARIEQLEAETQRVMARIKAAVPIDSREPNPGSQPLPQSQPVPAQSSADLAARSLEMARLRAELSKDFSAYQERPRKAFVGARASEYRFARYVEDWRSKIERVGNLNYPDEARRLGAPRWHGGQHRDQPILRLQAARPGGDPHRRTGRAVRRVPARPLEGHRHPGDHADLELHLRRTVPGPVRRKR
jgi:hypothetical protein